MGTVLAGWWDRRLDLMMGEICFLNLLLLLILPFAWSKEIKVFSLPGNKEGFLKMVKDPGERDFKEISVCMRWNAFLNPSGSIGGETILAAVMEGEGSGNKDEWFYLGMGTMNDGSKDSGGRAMGTYFVTSKGIKYFGGGPAIRIPARWNHVCVSVTYTGEGAERVIYADGKFNFRFTTAFLDEIKWLKGHNFTFGGRKFTYSGVHLNGMITDVQIFSRKLSADEMIGYTTC